MFVHILTVVCTAIVFEVTVITRTTNSRWFPSCQSFDHGPLVSASFLLMDYFEFLYSVFMFCRKSSEKSIYTVIDV